MHCLVFDKLFKKNKLNVLTYNVNTLYICSVKYDTSTMSIETDIKQTKFKNPYQRVAINLLYTTSWLSSSQACLLKPYDLTPQQYNVLRILRGQHPKPVRVNDIIERMLDKMSNASRLVDKLLLKGYVRRTECSSDRRAVDVVITDEGLTILSELDKMQEMWENQLKGLSEAEADLLSDLLDRLRGSSATVESSCPSTQSV